MSQAPDFTMPHLLGIFASSFGYPPEAEEISEIFPTPPPEATLPGTLDAILGLINDEKCDFKPSVAWYDELTLATCPLAVHHLHQTRQGETNILLEAVTYSARLYLHEVQVPADYAEIGPWKVLVIDVGRGAPLSYLV